MCACVALVFSHKRYRFGRRYVRMQHDENPMYVFDAGFGVKAASLLQDYHVRPYH